MKKTALGDAANIGNWLRHMVLACAIVATLVPLTKYHPWTKATTFVEKITSEDKPTP
jgi:hypothetical protein